MNNDRSLKDIESFWIVGRRDTPFGVYFSDTPHRHQSEREANAEAERLCRQHGGRFYVFECTAVVEKVDITTKRLRDPDADIPF